jgi:hypothetical protein
MSKLSTNLIPILEQLLVKEIGEASFPPLKWEQLTPLRFRFEIYIEEELSYVNVEFDRGGDAAKEFFLPPAYRNVKSFYNVGFDIDGTETQYAKTNIKILLQIMSTIVDIVKYFIKTRQPDALCFIATEKNRNSNNLQKSNLYQAFIKKGINSIPGYISDTYKDFYIVVKNAKTR